MSVNRNVVAVLGMHRAGTSVVAGMLESVGVRLGGNLVPARLDNPRGFFEHQEVVEVHKRLNRILQRRPMSRSGALHMPAGWTRLPEVQPYREKLRRILLAETQSDDGSPWGFKDPHTVRLLPLWQELFEVEGFTAKYLLCLRDPAAVCDSLARRDHLPRDHAELLWLMHYLDAIRHTGGDFAAVLEYECWFSAFDEQFGALCRGLSGLTRIPADAAGQARAFVEASLNHGEPAGAPANPLVGRLYAMLSDLAKGRIDAGTFQERAREVQDAAEGLRLWSRMGDAKTHGPQLTADTAPLQVEAEPAAAGGYPLLAARLTDAPAAAARPLKICIVTYELEGPTRFSEIASESADLAVGLARAGHAVTVLHVPGNYCEDGSFERWIEHYRVLGVTLLALPEARVPNVEEWMSAYTPASYPLYSRIGAYHVHQWLRKNEFDVVHGFDTRGALFYCLLAKRLRLHFTQPVFHVRIAGPEKLRKQQNALPLWDVQELANSYMERRSAEYADIVSAAGDDILREIVRDGYALPAGRTVLLPFIGCRHAAAVSAARPPIREIVFAGCLETRKGLNLFIDAINWLQRRDEDLRAACGGELPRVHFIGAQQAEWPVEEFLQQATAGWRLPVSWKLEAGRQEVLEYLAGGGRIAVLAAPASTAAIELDDCMRLGISFIAATSPAHRALAGVAGGADLQFELHPGRLAERLLQILGRPPVATPMAGDPAAAASTWTAWHASIAADAQPWRRHFYTPPRHEADPEPLVSVCVAHFNRPKLLRQCLDSLEKQTYRNVEVIVVDDGSTHPEAVACLDELEPVFAGRGWKIIRQENRYLGAVRNAGARQARGKYCLFMDDDNYAKQNEIQTFVSVAERTGAHVLTCFADVFSGEEGPGPKQRPLRRITQLGDNLAMGLFRNGYGDSNCFVRRDFFLDVGGNSEDYKVGNDDQEFFSRAILAGAKLFVVPEALYWYRDSEVRMRSLHYRPYAGNLRVMRPFLEAIHPAFRDILRLAQGQMVSFQKHRGVDRFQKDRAREKLKELLDTMAGLYARMQRPGTLPASPEQAAGSQDPGGLMSFVFDRHLELFGRFLVSDERRRKREEERRQRTLKQLRSVLRSRSWRLTGPLRQLTRRLGRARDMEISLERAERSKDPMRLLASVYSSASWQLTAPLRAMQRLAQLVLRRKPAN